MEPKDDTQTYANDSATSSSIDTGLTQRRSRRVLNKKLVRQLTKMVEGRVYFIQGGDRIKIGFSTNPPTRLSGLQTSSADDPDPRPWATHRTQTVRWMMAYTASKIEQAA